MAVVLRPSRFADIQSNAMDFESYRDIDGVWIHNVFREENVRSAINYKPREGDVIVVTYPKCGTNWMQYIICNIISRAKPPSDVGEYTLNSPFIEMTGTKVAENPSRYGPIATHLPLQVFQPVDTAKYIYVARNPYDCAVSFYHFILGLTPKAVTDVSFGRFLDMFIAGKVLYGDYFDHLIPWYDHRGDTNVLFITYEELKADTRAQVLRIAEFLGEEHGKALHQDEKLLERILDSCSLESMKTFFKDKPQDRAKKFAQAASKLSLDDQKTAEVPLDFGAEKHEGAGFVRKGIVGDWKNHFTADQLKKTKEWIKNKTRGSDVMNLWSSVDLP